MIRVHFLAALKGVGHASWHCHIDLMKEQ